MVKLIIVKSLNICALSRIFVRNRVHRAVYLQQLAVYQQLLHEITSNFHPSFAPLNRVMALFRVVEVC